MPKDSSIKKVLVYYHITTNCRKGKNLFTFFRISMYKNHHRKQHGFNHFTAVTPLMYFLLDRYKIFNPHFI